LVDIPPTFFTGAAILTDSSTREDKGGTKDEPASIQSWQHSRSDKVVPFTDAAGTRAVWEAVVDVGALLRLSTPSTARAATQEEEPMPQHRHRNN
jgi:hypothetical protein